MSAGDRDTREFDKFKAERLKDPEIKAAYDAACQATALAALLAEHRIEEHSKWGRYWRCTCGERFGVETVFQTLQAHRAHVADVLLASDWLAGVKAGAWDNGVDTAGQYAEQPWVVDDECKPLNPYRRTTEDA